MRGGVMVGEAKGFSVSPVGCHRRTTVLRLRNLCMQTVSQFA